MTPEQFCYWLQGFAEIHQDQPNGQEWLIIMDHLSQVFNKKTIDRPKEHLKRDIHDAIRQIKPEGVWPQSEQSIPTWGGNPPDIIC